MTAASLLATKLYIPRPRATHVLRPRLVARLNASLTRRLTLISAPAGFGKTTLLSEWISQTPHRVAWLSLDESDNDPIRFWTYVIASLQTLYPDLGEHSLSLLSGHPLQPLPAEASLTALINEVSALADDFALVLDDYHLIDAQPIHDGLTFLLEHLPPPLHLILATRSDPPLPIGRLRARDQLIELRADDLRFTPDETSAFLNQAMGLNLSAEGIALMETRTAGWIAGLQLAALAVRGRDARRSRDFIAALTGGHRYILDYLTGEVLQRQPESIQTFLLQTSILDRLSGALCQAVTGQSDAVTLLDQIVQANLFITPLDDERRWYRYHPLFADVLRHRLRHDHPDGVSVLYRRASDWHERHGSISEAIDYALAAGDSDRAGDLLKQPRAAQVLLGEGELTTLLRWLAALPDAVMRLRPGLRVAYAWVLALGGRTREAEAHLRQAEDRLVAMSAGELSSAEQDGWLGQIAALRSQLALHERDLPRAIELGQQALARTPGDHMLLRGVMAYGLGRAYRHSGQLEAAGQAFHEASSLGQATGHTLLTVYAIDGLADVYETQGHLQQAMRTRLQQLQLATGREGQPLPTAGMAYVGLGKIYRMWNELDTAARYTQRALELGQHSGIEGIVMDSLITLALVSQAQGDADRANETIEQVKQLALKSNHAPSILRVSAFEAQLCLAQNRLESATRWMRTCGVSLDDEPSDWLIVEQVTLARVLIAQGQTQADRSALLDAQKLLARLLRFCEACGETGQVIEVLVLQAVAFHVQGDDTAALLTLDRGLSLAEPEGYARVFLDGGDPMRALLTKIVDAIRTARVRHYARKLLDAFGKETPGSASVTPQTLIEPLSERELEVLRLIAVGKKNREIADELTVVLGTVKAHVNSIYRKLDVNSRVQAVSKARELGWL